VHNSKYVYQVTKAG